jgi:ATP phosphoribosyltransferase
MTTERWDDAKLDKFASTVERAITASDKRLTRIEQVVESNNRFLESFSQDLKRYTDSMNNLATRIDGVIATNNQDRQETNSRLGGIQRQVSALAKHLGVI